MEFPQRKQPKVFYGWWLVLGSFVSQFTQATLVFHSFGAYFEILREEFNASRGAVAGVFALTRLESGLLGPIQGWLIEKLGPKNLARIGAVLFGGGFLLLSQAPTLIAYYAAFLVVSIGASLAGFLTLHAVLANWFLKRRSMAFSLSQAGMGLGGLFVPVIAWSLSTFGWRPTAFYSGIFVFVVTMLLAQILRLSPEPYGYLPDGATITPADETDEGRASQRAAANEGFTVKEALRNRSFWLISFGHSMALFVVSAIAVNLVPHLQEQQGLSLVKASSILAFITASAMVGQLMGGVLGDRFDKRYIAAGCMVAHTIGMMTIAFSTTLLPVTLAGILHGLAWGARMPIMSSIRADYFGRRNFATIMGYSSMVVMLGQILGPIFTSVMADRFGTYQIGFVSLGMLPILGAVAFIAAVKPSMPVRATQAS